MPIAPLAALKVDEWERAIDIKRWTHLQTVTWSACRPRSASNSSTSRYDSEKRKYHPTASRMTSGSNCRHLNKPQTEDARRSHPASLSPDDCKVATLPLA